MRSTLWMGPPPAGTSWRCWTSLATTTSRRPCTASRSPAPSGTPTGRSSGSSGWSTRTSAKVGAPGQVPKATPLPAEQEQGLPSAQQGERPALAEAASHLIFLFPPCCCGQRTPMDCSQCQPRRARHINTHTPREMKDECTNPTKPSCLILDLAAICL